MKDIEKKSNLKVIAIPINMDWNNHKKIENDITKKKHQFSGQNRKTLFLQLAIIYSYSTTMVHKMFNENHVDSIQKPFFWEKAGHKFVNLKSN